MEGFGEVEKLRAQWTSGALPDFQKEASWRVGANVSTLGQVTAQRLRDEPQQVVPRELLVLKCSFLPHQCFLRACQSPPFPLLSLPFACFQPSGLRASRDETGRHVPG